MDVIHSSTPSSGSLRVELLLLQVLNQLQSHHNITTQQTVQALRHCLEGQKHEQRRRQELITQHQQDYSKLSGDYLNLQNLHLSAGEYIEDLEETLKDSAKKCEDKIRALERQLEKENLARMFCEREAKSLKSYSDLEQINKELQEMRNCSQNVDVKMNQISSTLQLILQNQIVRKDIELLENQLSVAKETLQNSLEMYARQGKELENETKKTQTLQEQNAQLETSLRNLQKQQQEQNRTFEAELQVKAEELKRKDDKVIDERKKNAELVKKVDELQKMLRETRKREVELEAEISNCSMQLEQDKTASESKLKTEQRKTQEAQEQLQTCHQVLNDTKQQNNVGRKQVTKAIEFTKQYKKYLASGNFNFALAVYGDAETQDVFKPSQSIFGTQITTEEAHKTGFSCGNGRYIPNCFKCDGTDDCGNRNDEHNCSTTMFPLGARVVRGTGWKWDNQDGVPPGPGTVIHEDSNGGWNRIEWDTGHKNSYRIGAEGEIDLRAAAGYFCGRS